jgi:L-fuconolactonase
MSPQVIDSHHHLWRVSRGDYKWLTADLGVLYRDYEPDDLQPLLARHGVARTIVVQAAESEDETLFLLSLAARHDFIAGVVGWLDFESPGFEASLAALQAHPKFVGLRPMLQGLADDAYVLRPQVLRNLDAMARAGVPLDILVFPRHLPHVVEAFRRVHGLRGVVDHLAKPPVARRELDPWRDRIAELAAIPAVLCKISGLVTEADLARWRPVDLEPYLLHVLDVFGADRLMWGSDWPVCLLAADYGRVLEVSRDILATRLDPAQLQKVFGGNARAFYGL